MGIMVTVVTSFVNAYYIKIKAGVAQIHGTLPLSLLIHTVLIF